ncbi:hypothetical protein DV737_g2255, partial [Chaetothyriales sp. CBS 132003]
MVKLKVTARVLTEDSYSHGILTQTPTPRASRKFLVIVRDPDESYFIGNLAVDIQNQYRRLYKHDLGKIKYLKDDNDNDLDPEQLVLDVFVNEGKAEHDGLDQDASINVVQDRQEAVHPGSAVPDLTPAHYHSRPRKHSAVPRFDAVTPTLGKRPRADSTIEETPHNDKRLRQITVTDTLEDVEPVPSIERSPELVVRDTQTSSVRGDTVIDVEARAVTVASLQFPRPRNSPSSHNASNINGTVDAPEKSWRPPTPPLRRSRLPTTPSPNSAPPTLPLAPDNHGSKSPARQLVSTSGTKFKKPSRTNAFGQSHGSEIEDSQMPKPDQPIPQPRLVKNTRKEPGISTPRINDNAVQPIKDSYTQATREDNSEGEAEVAFPSAKASSTRSDESKSKPSTDTEETSDDGDEAARSSDEPRKRASRDDKLDKHALRPAPKLKKPQVVPEERKSGLDSPGAQLSQTLQESAAVDSLPGAIQTSGSVTTPGNKNAERRDSSSSASTSSSPRRDRIGLGITDSPRKRKSFSASPENGKIPFGERLEQMRRSSSASVGLAARPIPDEPAAPSKGRTQRKTSKTTAGASVQQPSKPKQKSPSTATPAQTKLQGLLTPSTNEPILPAGMSLEEYEAMKNKMSMTEEERRNLNKQRHKASHVGKKGQDAEQKKDHASESKDTPAISPPVENACSKLPYTKSDTDKDWASMSDTAFLKAGGWANMKNFALSYGEKPDPDGYENAKRILGAMRQNDEATDNLTLLHSLHTRSLTQENALRAAPPADMKNLEALFANDPAAAKRKIDEIMLDKFIALDADKCAFVHSLILSTGATRVVEIGTSFGVSTVYLAAAVGWNAEKAGASERGAKGKGVVIATEKEAEKCKVARKNWHACGPGIEERIVLLEGDLEETLKEGGKVDGVLKGEEGVDGDGKVDFVLLDSAIVLADNTISSADRYTELLGVLKDPKGRWQSITLPFSGGFEMSVYLGS